MHLFQVRCPSFLYTLGIALLAFAGVALAQSPAPPAAPLPPLPEPTCEQRLTTVQTNANNFIQQLLEMETRINALRTTYGTVLRERDEALAKVKTLEQQHAPQAEAQPKGQ
jgi:hypothetical protein